MNILIYINVNINNYLRGINLFWLQRTKYSININRLRMGMMCPLIVARNAEFLTLTVELAIWEPGLPI